MESYVNVIGAGLAGCEAAYQISKRGINVKLYEMKPYNFSPAHSNKNFAEIVCSNSFKSNLITNACGLLKQEMRMLDSLLIKVADSTSVPAGQALAVDRELFSKKVTEEIKKFPQIEIIYKEVGKGKQLTLKELASKAITIVATGPLTSDSLSEEIMELTGRKSLSFYDAASPIIKKDTIDFNIAFFGDRYGKGDSSYINLPMNEGEYNVFYEELVNAQIVQLHDFEKKEIFEGCMPIEIMAKRGKDTMRFGPLKPVGFTDPRTNLRPYAVVQLRQDNSERNFIQHSRLSNKFKIWRAKKGFFKNTRLRKRRVCKIRSNA